jgi:hypothetical protein
METAMWTRRSLFAAVAAIALYPGIVFAQSPDALPKLARDGYALSQADAEGLEAKLKASPDDITARVKLLGFYFRGQAMKAYGHDATIEARRRHILWLIEHHPESEATGISEATIDRAGHNLADASGYDAASALWIEEARLHPESAAVLAHASRFFQLSSKERAIALLKQAQVAAPGNKEVAAQLGYVYALTILGVDMINGNGFPMSANVDEAKGDFARRALAELKTSTDPVVVGNAGWVAGQYGLILSGMMRGRFTVDYFPMVEDLLNRAHDLDPGNPMLTDGLQQLRQMRDGTFKPK